MSPAGARTDYGVVLTGTVGAGDLGFDAEATDALRTELAGARPEERPFFDRGPGYLRLAGGAGEAPAPGGGEPGS